MEPAMPPALKPDMSNEQLLAAYEQAVGWTDGAQTAKQMRAWDARAAELKKLVLGRMK